ncbi:VOC family protein [Mycolicibacterium palauense]|uniref:hypothetical protein n=1 Tax=Mycolicibacterium palauense TaxID=2034511 RepID=UPI000BFEC6BF|nr:hypothetical protein [Mycolicibacterium palauense]
MIGIRQVALLSDDLEKDTEIAEEALGTRVVHRDPDIARYGLRNAVLAMGTSYLELVTPIDTDCSAARRLTTTGPGLYMLITQVAPPLAQHRDRVVREGIRIIAELSDGAWSSIQLHPADVGVLISMDAVEGDEGWPPVGAHEPVVECRTAGVCGVVLPVSRPERVASALSGTFGLGAEGSRLTLGSSTIEVSSPGITEVHLRGRAGAAIAPFELCGVAFTSAEPETGR